MTTKRPKPLNKLVLVDRVCNPAASDGGIILPKTTEPQQGVGTVLALGEQVTTAVDIGDTVLFSRYSGTEVSYREQSYLLLQEDELMARI